MHVTGQGEAVFQVCLGLVVLDLARVDLRIEERETATDAVLFFFEEVQRDGTGVMRVEQAAPLVPELVTLDGESVPFSLVRRVEVIELANEHLPQRGDDVLRNLHTPVVVLHLSFDVLDRHRLTGAARAFGMPARADEVRVDDALAVLRVGDHQPGAAVTAVHGPFQIVLMGLGLLPGYLVRGEDVLHPVPKFRVHQRLVESVVAGSTEDDIAFVVRVREHLLDRGQPRCFHGPFRSRHAGEAAVDQLAVQHRGRVVPCGVCLERPPHQRGTVRVGDHGGNVTAELVTGVDVEVADGRPPDGAAGCRFLGHALGDLVGEVAGVELCDRGHDTVQQHSRWGLVNVLGRGHEHHAGVFEREVDRHVVGTVAGEPVNFMDDAVRDLVGLDVLDHPHQLRPVGLPRGLARVDELLHDDRVQVAGFAEVRVALRGDGEALVAAAALCLLLRGHTQVGDGEGRGLAETVETGGWRWGCQSHESCLLSPMGGSQRDDEASRGATRKRETRPPEEPG